LIFVFDSGVWISAFQFGGTPLVALHHAYVEHQIAVCEPILLEIRTTLTNKFGWSPRRIDGALADYLDDSTQVKITGAIRGICRDSKDDMVFECAFLSRANFIVSGDKDLLAVESYHGIKVLTPRGYTDAFLYQSES
jgi:putative PIN family toxin of toxin-antitoxin system